MGRVEKLIQLMCFTIPCHVVCNAHHETEPDEISGSSRIMVSVQERSSLPRFRDTSTM